MKELPQSACGLEGSFIEWVSDFCKDGKKDELHRDLRAPFLKYSTTLLSINSSFSLFPPSLPSQVPPRRGSSRLRDLGSRLEDAAAKEEPPGNRRFEGLPENEEVMWLARLKKWEVVLEAW